MEVVVRPRDLTAMHPRLLWEDIAAATVAVLESCSTVRPFPFTLEMQNVPGFGSDQLRLLLDPAGISELYVTRLRRTYEPSRLVELAAIAIAGLALYHGGGHEIMDIARRGSAADYLVGSAQHPLEIAGRSRRSDCELAWQQRWQRLSTRLGSGFWVCVAEFESATGRWAFAI